MDIIDCKRINEEHEKMTKKIHAAFSCINRINDSRFTIFYDDNHPYSYLQRMDLESYTDIKVKFEEGNVILEVYEYDDDNEYYSANYVLPEYLINNFITNDDTNCHNSAFITIVEAFFRLRLTEIDKEKSELTKQHEENVRINEISDVKQRIARVKAKYGDNILDQ